MKLLDAITQSDYETAAAHFGAQVAIAGADGHDGLYAFEVVDSMGTRLIDRHGMTADEIEREYPGLNWWPLRENGEWGEQEDHDA